MTLTAISLNLTEVAVNLTEVSVNVTEISMNLAGISVTASDKCYAMVHDSMLLAEINLLGRSNLTGGEPIRLPMLAGVLRVNMPLNNRTRRPHL